MISAVFLLAATLLAITPGPGIAYVVARTAAGGRTEGLASCLGTGLGGFVHVVAAALGLSLVIAESAIAFSLLKYVGAAYLIYLGIQMLRRNELELPAASAKSRGSLRAFREGVLVEALNVKTAIFFFAFLPQFVNASEPLAPQFILMGAICVGLNTFVDVIAVLAAAQILNSGVARATRARMLTQASGVTMIGLGVYLAHAKRQG